MGLSCLLGIATLISCSRGTDAQPKQVDQVSSQLKAAVPPLVAGALVLAEMLRIAHGGAAYTDLKVRLGALGNRTIRAAGTYGADDLVGIEFLEARKLSQHFT